MNNSLLEGTVSPEEAAAMIGVNAQTMRRYVREGRVKAYRIGGKTRLYEADIRNAFVQEITPSNPLNNGDKD